QRVFSRAMLAAAAVSMLCAAARGQDADPPAEPGVQVNTVMVVPSPAPFVGVAGAVEVLGAQGSVMGEVVTGKPYSAESVTESIQTLADGNRITSMHRARIYRDSEGRT